MKAVSPFWNSCTTGQDDVRGSHGQKYNFPNYFVVTRLLILHLIRPYIVKVDAKIIKMKVGEPKGAQNCAQGINIIRVSIFSLLSFFLSFFLWSSLFLQKVLRVLGSEILHWLQSNKSIRIPPNCFFCLTMQKVVEQFQSNWSAGLSVTQRLKNGNCCILVLFIINF